MREIYIDDDKKILIVGKPSFKYTVTHRETNNELKTQKIWVKKV